jgi:hypothetical protein
MSGVERPSGGGSVGRLMSMPTRFFPTGATLAGGAYVIGDRIAGDRHGGIFGGTGPGGRPVLVTIGGRQSLPHDQLFEALTLEAEGVTPLLRLETMGSSDILVEAEPDGAPLGASAVPMASDAAVRLVRDLAAVAWRLHDQGRALGVLHPDQIYVDEGRLRGVAPRARLFLATATVGDVRRMPLSRFLYQAPEVLAGAPPAPPADVFSLAAILAHLASGEPPFTGEGEPAQAMSIGMNRRRPWSGPDELEPLVAAGLAPDPAARPNMTDFTERLSEAR